MDRFKTNYLEEFPEIRTVSIEGQVWYVFKDICEYVKELSHQAELLSYVQKEDKTTIILSDDSSSFSECDTSSTFVSFSLITVSIFNFSSLFTIRRA